MSMKYFAVLFSLFCLSVEVQARPVSYPEGWTLIVTNDENTNSALIHYSPTAKYSIGLRHEYFREAGTHVDTVQLNNLLKRWNSGGQQANLYLQSGVGGVLDDGAYSPAAFTGIATDWETRRYFTSYENRFFWSDDSEKFIQQEARLGIAPYIGDYGDLHTWLMLQANYNTSKDDSFTLTPLVRFLKAGTLVEVGYSFDNNLHFDFIQRF